MTKKNYLENLIEQYQSNDFKISPHDFGTSLKSLLIAANPEEKYSAVDKLLKNYSHKEKPIRNSVMYALEKTIPSFNDESIRTSFYQEILDLVEKEQETWPKTFASWTLNLAKQCLSEDGLNYLVDHTNKLIDESKKSCGHCLKTYSVKDIGELITKKDKAKTVCDRYESEFRKENRDKFDLINLQEKQYKAKRESFEEKYAPLARFKIFLNNHLTYEDLKKDFDNNVKQGNTSKEVLRMKKLIVDYGIDVADEALEIFKLLDQKKELSDMISRSRSFYLQNSDASTAFSRYSSLERGVNSLKICNDNLDFFSNYKDYLLGANDNQWNKT
jgi:hypothetical protein